MCRVLEGAVDGLYVAIEDNNDASRACVPKEATVDELIRVTQKYIEENPKSLHYAAADVVWQAMAASYPLPCKIKISV